MTPGTRRRLAARPVPTRLPIGLRKYRVGQSQKVEDRFRPRFNWLSPEQVREKELAPPHPDPASERRPEGGQSLDGDNQ